MKLERHEVQRFYGIWKPLLLYVNERKGLFEEMGKAGPWQIPMVRELRDELWADESLLDLFALENPVGLSTEDLAIVKSWKQRVAGKFFVFRQLKKHCIFISGEDDGSRVYGVKALESAFDELVAFVPCYVETVLLPFGGQIIYDSLIAPYPIHFGRGIRASLNETYREAKEAKQVIETLQASNLARAV